MKKKKKKSVRDTWIPETWRYNGSGYQKSRKNELYRKRKHKGSSFDGNDGLFSFYCIK